MIEHDIQQETVAVPQPGSLGNATAYRAVCKPCDWAGGWFYADPTTAGKEGLAHAHLRAVDTGQLAGVINRVTRLQLQARKQNLAADTATSTAFWAGASKAYEQALNMLNGLV